MYEYETMNGYSEVVVFLSDKILTVNIISLPLQWGSVSDQLPVLRQVLVEDPNKA